MTDLFVNVYAVSNVYGGPEEGGWTFLAGEPVTSILVDREQAHREAWGEQISDEDYERMVENPRYVDVDFVGDFGAALDAAMRQQAEVIREGLRERFPRTGKRGSVLGGDDYDIRIESHYGRAFPTEVEPWS